ncbi:MAG: lytic transglycosylase domain-containing protein [Vicinamibacterales bacterium]
MGPRLAVVVLCCILSASGPFRERTGSGLSLRAAQAAQEPIAPKRDFERWLEAVRVEAASRGIRAEILDAALKDLEPLQIVTERDSTQAEFTLTLDQYLQRRLTARTVRDGRRQAAEHRALLAKVSKAYGVPPHVLVAVWGLESNYGRFSGVRPTVAVLATLAYDGRRGEFFRGELLTALEILDRGDVPPERLKGSWAGALGQPQFMPSTYVKFAEDFDGDGRRDIWASLPDVFASIARYLREHGWVKGERWGREVKLPRDPGSLFREAPLRTEGCLALRETSEPLPLTRWSELGVRALGGGRLPKADMQASLVRAGSRSFLVYANYEALIAYNCAHSYALSVALLSDRIAGSS